MRLLGNRVRNCRCRDASGTRREGPHDARSRPHARASTPASARHSRDGLLRQFGGPGSARPGCRLCRLSLDSSTAAARWPSFRIAEAASPRMPPIPRMIIWISLPALLGFLDLGPGIAQRYRPVKHQLARQSYPDRRRNSPAAQTDIGCPPPHPAAMAPACSQSILRANSDSGSR